MQQAFADDVRQEFSAPWAALFGRQHPLPTFFVNNTVTALVDYLCKVLRLALREAFSFSAQNLNIYLETSMSTTRSKDRAGLCSFTFANGHRCRSLRSTSHPHLCYYHARKESQATKVQALVFVVSGSVALLADLIHNFGDALTAVPLGIAFVLRSERAERIAGLSVVAAIFISACVAGVEAVLRLIHPHPPDHLQALALAGAVGYAGNLIAAQPLANNPFRLHSLSQLSHNFSPPLPSNRLQPDNPTWIEVLRFLKFAGISR